MLICGRVNALWGLISNLKSVVGGDYDIITAHPTDVSVKLIIS